MKTAAVLDHVDKINHLIAQARAVTLAISIDQHFKRINDETMSDIYQLIDRHLEEMGQEVNMLWDEVKCNSNHTNQDNKV